MIEITPEALENFVHKVKGLLEAITGKPYAIAQKFQLRKSIWAVYLDEDRIKEKDRLLMNKGAYWVQEGEDGIIRIYSWHFYDIHDVALDHGIHLRDEDVLLERLNWEKYRKRMPHLIAELEAAQRIASEANKKHGSNIKLWAGHKPYLETSFNAKGMGEDEKLQEIEKHTRAMYETWKLWDDWGTNIGREIYMKTIKKHMGKDEFVEKVKSRLRDITGVAYSEAKRKPGTLLIIVGDPRNEKNMAANRGVWFARETRDSIAMMSDNLNTVNAKNIEEHRLMERWSKRDLHILEPKDEFKETIISSELIEKVAEQVSEEFKVKIRMRKDKPILVTVFCTGELRPYGKIYEIEKHAKALAEAWNRIKNMTQDSK